MNAPRPVDLLCQALARCANNRSLLRRVEDGRIHEDSILIAAYTLARQAQVSARMLVLDSSNCPVEDRDLPTAKPKGYQYGTTLFLEVDGELTRLTLVYTDKRASLQVSRFADRSAAQARFACGNFVRWREPDAKDFSPHDEDRNALMEGNHDLDSLCAELVQAKLHQDTLLPADRKTGPRL